MTRDERIDFILDNGITKSTFGNRETLRAMSDLELEATYDTAKAWRERIAEWPKDQI